MTVFHLVLIKFKPEVDGSTINEVCNRFISLKDQCVHPTTKSSYIRSLTGGKDISIENLQNGYTHAFAVEFENETDRDYYVGHDEAHLGFVKSMGSSVAGVQVVDYVPGKF